MIKFIKESKKQIEYPKVDDLVKSIKKFLEDGSTLRSAAESLFSSQKYKLTEHLDFSNEAA